MISLINHHYCTLFDSNYLPQGRAMIESLLYHDKRAVIFVLCIDENVYLNLSQCNLSDRLRLINLIEIEKYNVNLLDSKSTRSKVEYYWTCGPAFLLYVFENYLEVSFLTYLDADLYFYSSPDIVFEQIASSSIAIVPHNFIWTARRLLKYGYYNVSWVSFRRDEEGLKCLKFWHLDCIDYCFDRLDSNGRYGDQKYLDNWTNHYKNVCVLQLPGVNLAIWNIGRYKLSRVNQCLLINMNSPLIFYHFSGLKMLSSNYFITNISRYYTPLKSIIKNSIYIPYILKIKELGYPYNEKEIIDLRRDNSTINGYWKRLLRLVYRDKIHIK